MTQLRGVAIQYDERTIPTSIIYYHIGLGQNNDIILSIYFLVALVTILITIVETVLYEAEHI